jgi:hypothetical protein
MQVFLSVLLLAMSRPAFSFVAILFLCEFRNDPGFSGSWLGHVEYDFPKMFYILDTTFKLARVYSLFIFDHLEQFLAVDKSLLQLMVLPSDSLVVLL